VPDAFSPNADGKNDVFNIRLGADATGMDIVIYDRWGNQVFHSNSILNGWDGMYNSKQAEVGVYHYLLQVKFRDGKTKQLTGDVSLIR
jgi:gliding motility-associated-like protein